MQQLTAREVRVLPQVEIERSLDGFRWKAEATLLTDEILVQRNHWRRFRDLTQYLADHELAADQRERRVDAATENGARRLHQLRQASQRATAQCGQRIRVPRRVDDL